MPSLAYEPTRFTNLLPIRNAAIRLDEFRNALPSLGATLRTFGLEELVGITLLHKHFELDPSERVLRSYRSREARIHAIAAREPLVPCLWSVENDGAMNPLEFVDGENAPSAVLEAEALLGSGEFLRRFAEVLSAYDAHEVFGLATLHGWRTLSPGAGETIVETTLAGDRELGLTVETKERAASLNLVETLWIFNSDDGAGIDCSVPQHCGIHCLGHPLD